MTSDLSSKTPFPKTVNPREAAYLALLAATRAERFISDTLSIWQQTKPSSRDIHLAQQLAYGASQRALTLDFIAQQLSAKKKLSLKLKERLLVHVALYQYYFLERLPLYAITNEMVKLAQKYCHSTFVGYLNALLRNLPETIPPIPNSDSIHDLSVRYSYPPLFIKLLIDDYGLSQAKTVLELGNTAAPTMVRLRPGASFPEQDLNSVCTDPFPMGALNASDSLSLFANSPLAYIQNVTPATLLGNLARSISKPERILDLCASPGGKLLAIHDLFPEAKLFANDVSEEKLKRLEENCNKYGLTVCLSCGPGEAFTSNAPFDSVILDVPCSNTGVLNKRPEARWRLSEESLKELEATQINLIKHAKTLLRPGGEIWYMTCSVLKRENEGLIERACKEVGLRKRFEQTILPNPEGWDGGYACALQTL